MQLTVLKILVVLGTVFGFVLAPLAAEAQMPAPRLVYAEAKLLELPPKPEYEPCGPYFARNRKYKWIEAVALRPLKGDQGETVQEMPSSMVSSQIKLRVEGETLHPTLAILEVRDVAIYVLRMGAKEHEAAKSCLPSPK